MYVCGWAQLGNGFACVICRKRQAGAIRSLTTLTKRAIKCCRKAKADAIIEWVPIGGCELLRPLDTHNHRQGKHTHKTHTHTHTESATHWHFCNGANDSVKKHNLNKKLSSGGQCNDNDKDKDHQHYYHHRAWKHG